MGIRTPDLMHAMGSSSGSLTLAFIGSPWQSAELGLVCRCDRYCLAVGPRCPALIGVRTNSAVLRPVVLFWVGFSGRWLTVVVLSTVSHRSDDLRA